MVGKGCDMRLDGNILTIKINLDNEYGPSTTGLSTVVASSGGNIPIADDGPYADIRIVLTCFKKIQGVTKASRRRGV